MFKQERSHHVDGMRCLGHMSSGGSSHWSSVEAFHVVWLFLSESRLY